MFVVNKTNKAEKNQLRKPNILRKKPKVTMKPYTETSEVVALVKPLTKSQDVQTMQIVDRAVIGQAYRPYLVTSNLELAPDNYEMGVTESTPSQTLIEGTYEVGANNNGYSDIFDNILQMKDGDMGRSLMVLEEVSDMFVCKTTPEAFIIPVEGLVLPAIEPPAQDQAAPAQTMFRCDMENCTKEFPSKQKLKKHIARHNKKSCKVEKQVLTCPAKKPGLEVTEACGQDFALKDDLVNHLKTDHTLDDALHSCTQCGRRFFWAPGVRAHRRACGGSRQRAPLLCPWEGCGRSFQQPCRLREHSRAHTGYRPYPCMYPNCGWSFRTASKLLRHARAHTGERRHECAACGALFSRKEHLREHATRHAAPRAAARRARAPRPADCKEKFPNRESLAEDVWSAHCDEGGPDLMSRPEQDEGANWAVEQYMAPSDSNPTEAAESLHSEANEHERSQSPESESSWRAARTHCTWPLGPTDDDEDFAEEEPPVPPCVSVRVELSEESESNLSAGAGGGGVGAGGGAVRSDLFLHGDLHNDDSESTVVQTRVFEEAEGVDDAEGVEGAEGAALLRGTIDAELGLLDHPTIDLMPEELMYSDAVDETSFHVLLLGDI